MWLRPGGVGRSFTLEACGLWVIMWGSGQRRCVPRVTHPTLCTGRRKGQGREVVRCCSLQASANGTDFGRRGSIGLAPDYQPERDELLLRKEAALQLCVHVSREEELSWQGEVRGARRRAPSVSLQLRLQAEEYRGSRGLVFRELKVFLCHPVASLFERQLSVLSCPCSDLEIFGEWCTHRAGLANYRQQRNYVCAEVCIG